VQQSHDGVGFAAGPGMQLKLAQAALSSGIRRYFPWQFGVDYDAIGHGSPQNLFDEQLDVRDLLRGQQATNWVIISTGMLTSFLFEPAFGVVDVHGHVVHALGDWDTAVTLTTPDDIGTLTAEVVLAQPEINNRVIYLAGDTITYGQLAELVDELLGGVERVRWPVPLLLDELARDPGDSMKKYRAVFAQGVGVAWDKDSTFNVERGIATITAAHLARKHLR
jgi:hypothetical protein